MTMNMHMHKPIVFHTYHVNAMISCVVPMCDNINTYINYVKNKILCPKSNSPMIGVLWKLPSNLIVLHSLDILWELFDFQIFSWFLYLDDFFLMRSQFTSSLLVLSLQKFSLKRAYKGAILLHISFIFDHV